MAQYTFGEVQSCTHREGRHHKCQGWTGPHRQGELPVRLFEVATARGEPGARRKGQHGRWVVVHLTVLDARQRDIDVLGRLLPPAAIHGRQRQFGLADDTRVSVAQRGCRRGRLRKQDVGLVDVSAQQVRLGVQGERRITPGAPRPRLS
jgi:hypothetical protein